MPTPTSYQFSQTTDFVGLTEATPDLGVLLYEVQQSSIYIAIDYCSQDGDDVTLYFKDVLDSPSQATLAALIAAHTGEPIPGQTQPLPVNVYVNDDSDRTLTGVLAWDRDEDGMLIPPHGTAFPTTSVTAGEMFWRTDEAKLYRRNNANSAWVAVQGDITSHASTHENGGADEIDVTGLSGVLADAQTPASHAIAGPEHSSSTLAQLNSKIVDATLDDSSDPRVPTSHASSHQHGGSDEIATATPGANAIPKADSGGKLAAGWIPAVALPSVSVVANATARLALTVEEGDEAIQLDDGSHWIYDGSTWYERPQGGGVPPEVFATNESGGGQVIGDWPPTDVTFDDEYTNSDGSLFDWDAAGDVELTITQAGKIVINAQIGYTQTSGGSRTIMYGFLQHQPNGGSFTYIWGSKASVYLRNNTNGNKGSMACQATLEVGAGDKIKVVSWRESGSGTQVIDGDATSLCVTWFPN